MRDLDLDNADNPIPRRGRGFAGMDPSRQRDIAREGGRAAHEQGKAHEFTPEEARAAGLKSKAVRLQREQDAAAVSAAVPVAATVAGPVEVEVGVGAQAPA
ncbi:KGG domain-containing protein [Variovorax sp. KK3]|uniref:KGG domain-containing protein n=1 Tax=Variovorax sp. KK3 TaxID=1855728 RepID=UPI0009FA76A4|nr:KGG domain-containing protein [Variovorax sp. KK3]